MSNHQRVKHQGVSFDCDECDIKFSTRTGLKLHTDNKHKGVRYKAASKVNMKIHNQAMHESFKYPCDRCNYIASTKRSLTWHKRKCKELKIS